MVDKKLHKNLLKKSHASNELTVLLRESPQHTKLQTITVYSNDGLYS